MTKVLVKIPSSRSRRSITKEVKPFKNVKKKLKSYKQKVIKICELPNEVLDKILGHARPQDWGSFRLTCRRFQYICESKIKHDFKTIIRRLKQTDPKGYKLSIMRLMVDMTKIYLEAGFESLFYGAFLPLIKATVNYFPPQIELIKPYLVNFFSMVDEKLRDAEKQRTNLLYILTLLSTLKLCKNSRVISSKSLHVSDWNIVFELTGFWFGLLYSSEQIQLESDGKNQYDILVILSEVLLSDYSNLDHNFKSVNRYIWEGARKVFVCGHKTKRKNNCARILYYINMNGTQRIMDFIRNYFNNEINIKIDWNAVPTDEFDLNVKVTCKEALSWGCCSDYTFNIGASYEE